MTNEIHTLHQRIGHIAVTYKHYVLVWGGLKRDLSEREVYPPSDHVWFYDCTSEVWFLAQTKGGFPFRYTGATAVVFDDHLYIYGGVEESSEDMWHYSSNLHRLDLKTLKWTTLLPHGSIPQGCDKGVGWVYDGKLYFFGGYGQKSQHSALDYSFDLDIGNLQDERGWHNQLSVYDPASNSWFVPSVKGNPPSPRATHACDLSGHKVYIFGGRSSRGRLNDMYCLDLKSMTWISLKQKPGTFDMPEGRSWHSLNFISEKCAIVYGGLNPEGNPCVDWWKCCIENNEVNWIQKEEMERCLVWHKAAFSPVTKELIIVGGVTCSPYEMNSDSHVGELQIIQFAPVSLIRLCLEVVIKKKLWLESQIPKSLLDILKARTELSSVIIKAKCVTQN